jgi:anti-sigma regulatory factor (Ser/Thr protein kinase)
VRLTLDFVADPANVRTVRKLLAAAARIEGATDFETLTIEVAAAEVLVRERLLAKDRTGALFLSADLSRSRCVISVREPDTGHLGGTPGNGQAEERLRWGLYIIAQLMDEVEIRPSGGKWQTSILRLVKQLGKNRPSTAPR